MKKTYPPNPSFRRAPPPHYALAPNAPLDSRPSKSTYSHHRSNFPANYRLSRPPGPTAPPYRPNFAIELRSNNSGLVNANVESLIAQCKPSPENSKVLRSGPVAGGLFFSQWNDALEATVNLWDLRFDGAHCFEPRLIRYVSVASDIDELQDRLQTLFSDRVRRLIDGEEVKRWRKKLQDTSKEIDKVTKELRRPNSFVLGDRLLNRKKGLISEKELLAKRLGEFESAMNCILAHLQGKEERRGGGW
ncbi:hypothetical protein CJ030_MR6G024592 [Morella rubra]|uniref:Uncharacterized protein n=1 Tax=Morella rubra TaxID=262757 RepID=A0A6A1VGI2_9ROSI|nr:hypothetical protein CJ030_MR6G024592 [Morella rubra]